MLQRIIETFFEFRQLIPIYLLIVTVLLSISCAITLLVPYSICTIIPALTTYGKAADQTEAYEFINYISVPKRWFKHFYFIGACLLLFFTHLMYRIYTENYHLPDFFIEFLATLTRQQSNPPITFTTSVLIISLLMLHVFRRLYETLFVSVYSDSRMNIFHYFIGIVHYVIVPFSILCETEGVSTREDNLIFDTTSITIQQWMGAIVFSLCNWQQHKIAEKIANTRKGPRGLIRNYAYGISFGGWFNYVSCPHFLFEILIYLSLWSIIPTAYAYRFIVLFVCVNQTFAAQITHKWYLKTFQKYPSKRKALIPYIL